MEGDERLPGVDPGSEEPHGYERERQVRETAARLGVADFVYAAPPVKKGSALREASGDGLLIVGNRGAVLQVKARDPAKGGSDSEDRAVSWIRKQAAKARAQGVGTKREITRRRVAGDPLTVTPLRAALLDEESRRRYDLTVSMEIGDWPVVVVLDHPACPEVDLGFAPGILWITFSDWQELHRRLRSTAALLDYCRRIANDRHHVPLGNEVKRYAVMRDADERSSAAAPGSTPYLVDHETFDTTGTDLFHDVINKVWPDDGPVPWHSASEYRAIVEFLDVVPPQVQAIVGRWFLQKRVELASGRQAATGLVRIGPNRLVYGCADRKQWEGDESWSAEFSGLTALRHTHALESHAPKNSITLGVGALVDSRPGKNGVAYTFCMLVGQDAEMAMTAELRAFLESRYGIHSHTSGTTREAKVERNARCPCMSGKKFKKCCGRLQ